MADSNPLLDREIIAAGYEPTPVAADVAVGVLIDRRAGRDPTEAVIDRLSSPYLIHVHPNTARAIARDHEGLRAAIRRLLDEEADRA